MKNEITCKLYNKNLGFEVEPFIYGDTNALLFLPEDVLKESGQYISIDKNIFTWIKEEKDLYKPFVDVAKFIEIEPDELLRVFLELFARESKQGYVLLCENKSSKKKFLADFREEMKFYMDAESENVIAPDILMCAMLHVLIHKTQNTSTFEIPDEIAPYILNIEGVMPDSPPEGFDPNIPYESDTPFEENKKNFFEKFFSKN